MLKTFIKNNGSNVVGLYLLHFSTALQPILVFPRLLYALGSDVYSGIAVSEAAMFVIQNIVLFGFEISGVGLVLENVKNIRYIFQSRFIIFIVTLLLGLMIFSQSKYHVFLLWFIYIFGIICQNNVYFLGVEKNDLLAKCVLPGRLISLCLVYTIVDRDTSVATVLLILGGPVLLSSVSVLYVLRKLKLFVFTSYSLRRSIALIKSNIQIFISSFSVLLFKDFNVIVVGALGVHPGSIATYSMAEKAVKVFQSAIRPMNQFYYKRGVMILEDYNTPNGRAFYAIMRLVRFQMVFLIIGITLFIIMMNILNSTGLNKDLNDDFLLFVSIMLPAVIFGLLNYFLGSLGLNYLGSKSLLLRVFGLNGVLSLLAVFVLTNVFGVHGVALSFLFSEILLVFLLTYSYFRGE